MGDSENMISNTDEDIKFMKMRNGIISSIFHLPLLHSASKFTDRTWGYSNGNLLVFFTPWDITQMNQRQKLTEKEAVYLSVPAPLVRSLMRGQL